MEKVRVDIQAQQVTRLAVAGQMALAKGLMLKNQLKPFPILIFPSQPESQIFLKVT